MGSVPACMADPAPALLRLRRCLTASPLVPTCRRARRWACKLCPPGIELREECLAEKLRDPQAAAILSTLFMVHSPVDTRKWAVL